ncbi:MAG: SURF1 family protein [Mycobacteriaceae bacterium]
MRRLRFLLKPGWLALAVVVAGFAYLCFSTLARWQLGKNSDTEQRNAQINASFSAQPTPLAEILVPGREPPSTDEWRRVSVTGTYLADKQVLARLRSVLGGPAYEVLTPLRITDGPLRDSVVLVDRGFVRPVQGTQPPPVDTAPAGPVRIEARLRLDEQLQQRANFDTDGVQQVYAVNAAAVGSSTGLTITPGYLQLPEDQPGVLNALPLPQLDAGPYLSYGLQWIAFGVMAPLGLGYFVWAELRERRNRHDDPTSVSVPDAAPQPEPEPVPMLVDRYGKRR